MRQMMQQMVVMNSWTRRYSCVSAARWRCRRCCRTGFAMVVDLATAVDFSQRRRDIVYCPEA